MKESSVTTGEKKEESKHDLAGNFFFFFLAVVVAKQKAHSYVDPSLLWYGGQACWSSVCICAPVQTSSTVAPGWRGGTVGRVCLLTMAAGGQIAPCGESKGGVGREAGRTG